MKNVNKLLLKDALKELLSEDGESTETEEIESDEGESSSEGLKGLLTKLKEKDAVAVDDKAVVMKKESYDKEHKDLVKTLEEKDPKKLDDEAEAQAEEKEEVDEDASDSPTNAKAFLKVAMMLMKKKK